MAEEATGATETPETVEAKAAPSIEGIISEMVMPEGEKSGGEEPPGESAATETVLSQDEVEPEASGETKEKSEDWTSALPPEVQHRVDKRIGKEVAKRKSEAEKRESAEGAARDERLSRLELESENQELRAQLEERGERATAPDPSPTSGDGPASTISTIAEWNKASEQAEGVLDFVDSALEQMLDDPEKVADQLREHKVELKDSYGEEDYSRERMEQHLLKIRRAADKMVRRHLPARKTYLDNQAVADEQADKLFPWLRHEDSREFAIAQDVLNTLPEIKRLPHWKMTQGVYVLGLQELEKMMTGKAPKSSAKSSPPPSQPGAPAVASAPTGKPNDADDATKTWAETGSDKAFEKYLNDEIIPG